MKLKDKNTRKLLKIGKTSLAVTLPIEITKDLGWFTLLNREALFKQGGKNKE